MTVDQLTHIPIVDLSEYRSGTSEQRQYIARDLAHACCVVGFVYIAGHGIPAELQQDAFTWSKKLFDLKHEDKMKAPHPSGPSVHRGYSHPGFEKVSQETGDDDEQGSRAKALRQIADYKESYEIGSEENAAQPNIWLPEQTLPGFRAFMTKFYWEFHKTARLVLQVLAQGIDLAEEDTTHFIQLHSGQNNQLRLLHYPPVPAAEVESQAVARMPAHSDWSSFTMLFQDDCGGLEAESAHQPGNFLPAKPIPGTLVLNIGDLLQRWSNDQLKSTLHRVTLPPLQDRFTGAERMTRARFSIPYFVSPDPTAVIDCFPACMDEQHPVKYPPIMQRDYGMLRAKLHYEEEPATVAAH